jgi:hypothetical protein
MFRIQQVWGRRHFFSIKENILISEDILVSAITQYPNGNMDAHSQKREN